MSIDQDSIVHTSKILRENPKLIEGVAQDFLNFCASEKSKDINWSVTWDKSAIESQVAQIQSRLKQENIEALPLAGIPIVIKDNICTKDLRTTCASKMLEHFNPGYDATAVARLRNAGALIVAKANMDEFGMGTTNENSAFGPVRNPIDREKVAGGSSGGSAAVVGLGGVPVSIGSDTGGSVRTPASFCGVVGFKPSYGSVSRFGLIAYGSSLDQIGLFARKTEDVRRVYHVIHGVDPLDSTSQQFDLSMNSKIVSEMTFGFDREVIAKCDPSVVQHFLGALERLRNAGLKVKEVEPLDFDHALPCYYILACAEASSNLARFDGIRYGHSVDSNEVDLQTLYSESRSNGFGSEVKKRIMLGTYALSTGYYDAFYAKAIRLRHSFERTLARVFKHVDFLVTPTFPRTVPKIGGDRSTPLEMYQADRLTVGANLAGIPALSLPCGLDSFGMPQGFQIWGPKGEDEALLNVAASLEQIFTDS